MSVNVTAPKNTVFQLRMNSDVKTAAEELFNQCGLTLTDALNLFIQQSLNHGGIPFEITKPKSQMTKDEAIDILLSELDRAHKAYENSGKHYTDEEIRSRFGL